MLQLLVAVLAFLSFSLAHRIDIEPGVKACFYEILNPEDRVGHGGQMDIDFYVTAPSGNTISTQSKQAQGTFSTTATSTGRYTYCFSNEMSSYATKTVSFNVHGVLYSDTDEMGPVEEEIRDLASGLQLVKDEQAYLVVRERVHRNTCESTNSRVKWWAVAQIGLLLAMCAWNVHYLKSWFEVKRVL